MSAPGSWHGKVVFGIGLETGIGEVPELIRHARQADEDGLDVVSLSDHPYFADRLDSYAALGFVLGATTAVAGAVNVTNLPSRPAPMLARSLTSLSALSGGRVVFGIGGGGLWDEIVKLGNPRRSPAAAVRAMEEAIIVVRALSGGGGPVDFDGEFYQLAGAVAAPVPAPPIWTGSNGPKSLAVTGRLADGWIPGHAADWVSQRVRISRPVIDEAAAAAGRDPADVATIYNVVGSITSTPSAVTRDQDGRWTGGAPEQWAEELTAAVLEHGADGFIYFPDHDSPDVDTSLSTWSGEIVPAVREALADS
jgi:alkanesulfonate monooxygenase SsuD/methylene tetrahydromethanopterin reductase-like flavin-dependent oxidoreductase (luciferase family)